MGVFYTYTTTASSNYYSVHKDTDVRSYAGPGGWGFRNLHSFNRNALFMFFNATQLADLNYTEGYNNGIFEDV